MEKRPVVALIIGVVTCVFIATALVLAEESSNGLPGISYRTVNLSIPNVGHLEQHDPVDIAGVLVGQVSKETAEHNKAFVTLQMTGVGPLPTDTTAVIRADGLLGARYVELEPGTDHTYLANGATIDITNPLKSYTWGVPEFLDLFDTKTRTALGNMMNGFGEGLEGRGQQLGQAIGIGTESGHDFDLAVHSILSRPNAAYDFLGNFASGTTALDNARNQLAAMLGPSAAGLEPLVQDRANVGNTIDAVDYMEPRVNAGLGAPALTLLSDARHLAAVGDSILPKAPAALKETSALLVDATKPLNETRPVLNVVPAASSAANSIFASLKPDILPVKSALTNLVGPVSSLAEHGCDIQNSIYGIQSLATWGTNPGGNDGPDVGFEIGVVAGAQDAANLADPGAISGFPRQPGDYSPPCAYSPGPEMSGDLLQTATQALGNL